MILGIKRMHFSFVNCMHLLNIIVYWFVLSTICAQQTRCVCRTQTSKLHINMIFVYMALCRIYVSYLSHCVIWSDSGQRADISRNPFWYGLSMCIPFAALVDTRKVNTKVN